MTSRGAEKNQLDTMVSEIGARIKNLRTSQGRSLAEVSAISTVSISMLSHIERGKASPSLTTLSNISRALGVEINEILSSERRASSFAVEDVIVRGDQRKRIDFSNIGIFKEVLSPGGASDLEVLMLVVSPGGTSGPKPWSRNSEKAGLVVEGTFELTIADSSSVLKAGDSFQFDGRIPHTFRNLGANNARIVWIIRPYDIA